MSVIKTGSQDSTAKILLPFSHQYYKDKGVQTPEFFANLLSTGHVSVPYSRLDATDAVYIRAITEYYPDANVSI